MDGEDQRDLNLHKDYRPEVFIITLFHSIIFHQRNLRYLSCTTQSHFLGAYHFRGMYLQDPGTHATRIIIREEHSSLIVVLATGKDTRKKLTCLT